MIFTREEKNKKKRYFPNATLEVHIITSYFHIQGNALELL